MPKILPSHVVASLGARFATPEHPQFTINPGSRTDVAAILTLFDALSRDHFALLAPERYVLLESAVAETRAILKRWENVTAQEYGQTGGPVLPRSPALGNLHPIQLIRDILIECPDIAPGQVVVDLPFLHDPPMEGVLRQDMTTANTTLANGEYKASMVIAGSVIEALLLWAVQRPSVAANHAAALTAWQQRPAAGLQIPAGLQAGGPGRWDFWFLIGIARDLPVITEETALAVGQARDFRNLIHAGRAQRLGLKPSLSRAQLAVGAMNMTVDDLAPRGL